MSYILDALRKAESERERDASALGASLSGAALPATAATSLWHRLLPGLAVGFGLGLAALLAWYGLNGAAPPVASTAPDTASDTTLPGLRAPAPAPSPVAVQEAPQADTRVVQVPVPASTQRTRTPRPTPRDERTPASDTVIDMPDEVRRSLPPLHFGGAMYSDKPSSRMLVINGRVFHEGDAIAPDLTLETIQLKSAVLRLGAQRYSITY